MERLALFPGTFDPFTLGHLDIAQRALQLFDAVEIVVAANPDKRTTMPAPDRADLIRQATEGMDGLTVRILEGLIAPYACARGAVALVRGIRSPSDHTYEAKMAVANGTLCPGLETVLLFTAPGHAHTSGSLVREIARGGGDCTPFVPPVVAAALRKHFESED